MAAPGHVPALIAAGLIVLFGIIHFGAGVGVTARYHQYQDIFRPSVGLSAFNIVIGIYAVAIGIVCLIAIIYERPALSKIGAICSIVLTIIALSSFIAALVINSQTVGYIRGRLSYRMNSYIEIQGSIDIFDLVQTNYECCGENLWLDWARSSLGAISGNGIGGGTNNNGGTNGGGGGTIITGRRRRHLDMLLSPLVKAVRQRRQTVTDNGGYGLPSSYSVNLPLSCCTNGGTSTGNTLGGYCVFNAGNSTNNFYVQGCLAPLASVMVVQATGIAIMNVCLIILGIVIIPILIFMFPAAFDPSNLDNKQSLSDQRPQEQGIQNGSYYATPPAPNAYYGYSENGYAAQPAYAPQPGYAQQPTYAPEFGYASAPAYGVDPAYITYQ